MTSNFSSDFLIGKESKDLLTKDFPADGTFKVSSQSKTNNGLNIKATLNRILKRDKSGIKEVVTAVVEPKFEYKERNIEFSGKLSTSNDFSGGVIIKEIVPKTEIEFKGSQSGKEGVSASLSASYKTKNFSGLLNLSHNLYQKKSPTKLNGELFVEYPTNLFLGTNFTVNLEQENTQLVSEAALGYNRDNFRVAARGIHSFQKEETNYGFSFHHTLNDSTNWALDFDVAPTPSCTVGAAHKIDNSTTLKGKWNVKLIDPSQQPEMRVGMSVVQKLTPNVSATFGTDLNLRALIGYESISEPHSFGLDLRLLF